MIDPGTSALLAAAALATGAVAALVALIIPGKRNQSGTLRLLADPAALATKRRSVADELAVLETVHDLQRGVFEVSAELVGCIEESDALERFAAAMRRYWACASVDLMIWERGEWRTIGGAAHGAPPALTHPVLLPEENTGTLVLDLSPGVAGQAALLLRGAVAQPSLAGLEIDDRRWVAEVLRGQFALSLRRVVLYRDLQALARIDPLTGAHRRWYGEGRLQELCESGEVVAVAMVDIDHFKGINDEHGHAAGDRVLAAVGKALTGHLRTGDLVSRFGGEEFLVILPNSTPEGAELVAGRLRAAVEALGDLPRTVTVSIGLAAVLQDETALELVQRADQAMYAAKQGGRNRVIVAAAEGAGPVRTTARQKRRTDTVLPTMKPAGG